MKEESLDRDLKCSVAKQLSDLPESVESGSQSWARAHLVSPQCPTSGLSLPTLSALLPPTASNAAWNRSFRSRKEAKNPLCIHFLCLLSGAQKGGWEDLEMYLQDTGARWFQGVISRSRQVCLQNVQTQMNVYLEKHSSSLPENMWFLRCCFH